MTNKEDFMRSFLPESVREMATAQIDLDITNLGIADILRNLNRTYPKTSRERNKISSGEMVVGILLKSELLTPLRGIIILMSNDKMTISAESKKYVVFAIDESKLTNDDDITYMVERITVYLAKTIKSEIKDFNLFYKRYVYDESQSEDDEDDE